MNNIYKYFNYNYIKIIKENIKNNTKTKTNKKIENLIIKKEITAVIFVVLNFLATYIGLKEIYQMSHKHNVIFYVLKDNILTSIIWFIILSILPMITNIINKKSIKSKYYLILLIIYLLSNLYNLIMIIYFISTFINGPIIGIIGIVNVIVTIIINMNIIVEITENNLKKK